jgi:hypothetical protein
VAIRPYSIAVAPLSSFRNLMISRIVWRSITRGYS